jgi:hypothetical protein
MVHSLARGREVGEVARKLKSYRILPDLAENYRVPENRAARRKSGGSFLFNIHIVRELLC